MISGLPGSGKTTCGRWLSDKYKIPYVDYDGVIQPFMTEVYDRFYQGRAYDEFCAIWRECCYETFWNVIAENLRAGINIAASAPLSQEMRQPDFFAGIKSKYDIEFMVLSLILQVPEKVLYSRIVAARQSAMSRRSGSGTITANSRSTQFCGSRSIRLYAIPERNTERT